MKTFFASLLGSFVGVLVAVFFAILLIAGMVTALVSNLGKSKENTEKVSESAFLHLKLNKKIAERSSKNPFDNFSFNSFSTDIPPGLNDILAGIDKAKDDPKIKGIYLDLSVIPAGIATLEEIRNGLLEFRKSGKVIYSYGETYSQGAYYLASVSDKIFLNPAGAVEWRGLSAQIMFYKGLMDKLDVSAQIFRHGKFKSAIEPFDLDKMSPASREQTLTYISSIWNHILDGISARRHISVPELTRVANELLLGTAEEAKAKLFVDELYYPDQVSGALNKILNKKESDKVNLVTIETYSKTPKHEKNEKGAGHNKIAIVYACGQIESGEGDENTIGSDRISKAIREARLDTSVKAIVLRVNSPGGSALASDIIWRETVLAQKTKPFVVSMGDVAASGGYYISCAADKIYAEPNTITGSIGVFGILPNIQKLLNNKLGITIDTVKTNHHADMGSAYRPVSAEERKYILDGIQNVYAAFITKVGEGRKMDTATVDSIGQGRVWSGADAKRIGLVDELGGIEDALVYAAQRAKLTKYKILSLPKQKDTFFGLFSDMAQDEQTRALENILGEEYTHCLRVKSFLQMKGVQARMPYDILLY